LFACLSVCLSVMSTRISQEPSVRTSQNSPCVLTVAVTRSFSGGSRDTLCASGFVHGRRHGLYSASSSISTRLLDDKYRQLLIVGGALGGGEVCYVLLARVGYSGWRGVYESLTVDPSSSAYYRWLLLISVAVVYNLVIVVARTVFWKLHDQYIVYWIVCDFLADVVYLTDIFVNMRTGTPPCTVSP